MLKSDRGGNAYDFVYAYTKDGKPYQEHLRATLTNTDQGAGMTVQNAKETSGPTSEKHYLLLNWKEANNCAIMYFRDKDGKQKCELHAWDSAAPEALTNCNDIYERYCNAFKNGQPGQIVYFSNCTMQPGC